MYGCQQVLVSQDRDLINILTFLCKESHKLTNMGIYYARQLYFKAKKGIGKYDLEKEYKTNNHYKVLHSQAAQQILRTVVESFRAYYGLVKAYQTGKVTDRPRTPNYRKKGGLATVSYPKQALKLKDRRIRIPLGNTFKRWFGLDSFSIPMPRNLDFAEIKELRILPRNKCFYFEFIYKKETEKVELNQDNVLGIDPGLVNWLTCVSNVGTSFIIDGKHVKSMNRWYNKQLSTIKENKPQGFWNNKLAAITEKRNRQIRDGINKAARIVINHCLENNIGTIVFGWNKRNKDSINIGKKNNSEFVPIPTARLKDRIAQLCEQYGLLFLETEESYTSKTSFLDGDYLPTYGEKPDDWEPSGKRTERGLFKTANNWYINADCNGAANIIRKGLRSLAPALKDTPSDNGDAGSDLKVATNLSSRSISLERVSRALLTAPHRIKLWSANKNKMCKNAALARSETTLLESSRL